MISRRYRCNACGLDFERTVVDPAAEQPHCPACGSGKVTIESEEEKKPADCKAASGFR